MIYLPYESCEYCKLKTAIAEKHPQRRASYTELKSDIIGRVQEQRPQDCFGKALSFLINTAAALVS